MATVIRDYARDLAAVFHGVLEENKVHHRVRVVVIIERLRQLLAHSVDAREAIVEVFIERSHEVGKYEWLRVVLLVELGEIGTRE